MHIPHLPQNFQEALTQHYVVAPVDLVTERVPEKPRHKDKIVLSDLDDTTERFGTPSLFDLFVERLGSDYVNRDFGTHLPTLRQRIKLMYQSRDIMPYMLEIADIFRKSGVTRGQLRESSEWAIDNYQINPGFTQFVRDLNELGYEFILNTGNFEYPVQLFAAKYEVPLRLLNYTLVQYSNQTDAGVVVALYPNVLWNKQVVNRNEAEKRWISQHMTITMAESPKFEPFLPMYAGLAVWVDPHAHEEQVESHVNLYAPEAKENLTALTPRFVNWEIGLRNSKLDSQTQEAAVIKAVEEIKSNLEDLAAEDAVKMRKASLKIREEAKELTWRVRRYRPRYADKMEGYMHLVSRQNTQTDQRRFTEELVKIIAATNPEYYATGALKENLGLIEY